MFHTIAVTVTVAWVLIRVLALIVAPTVIVTRTAIGVFRWAHLPWGSRRFYLLARYHRLRWRWLAKASGLAWTDDHGKGIKAVPVGTSVVVHRGRRPGRQKVRYPRARFRADVHGLAVTMRAIPKAGREEVEAASSWIADSWRCQRVSVSAPKPGKVAIRGFFRDPLLESFGLELAPPAGVSPHRVWLGKDEHGADRFLDLRNVSGVCVSGQPGGGKSQALTSWETQLAPSPAVQFVNIDGKGAGEFDDFSPRAWVTSGDSMERFLATLESLVTLMYARLRVVREFCNGAKNIWTVGVSPEWPLQFSIFDETQTFFDMAIAKALDTGRSKDHENACARAINLGSDLVRKGRSVGMCSVFSTQKPTSDSLPSAISSNAALSIAFSLRTLEAAKAALGQDVGNFPLLSPVTLSLPDYAGVAIATLRDGQLPFTRLRSPLVTESEAAKVAADTAQLRADPRDLLPVTESLSATSPALELVKAS